jgi:hypothetical protein
MRTRHDWPVLIEQWRASGLSRKAFCRTHDLPYQSFLWNMRRREESGTGEFRQLILKEEQPHDRIDYHFADGRCVSFPLSASKELIRFLLSL